MKRRASKSALIVSMVAVMGMFVIPAVHAASGQKGASRSAKEEADLRKYDRNQNGKLDPDERAAQEADARKAEEEKKRRESQGKRE